MSEDIGTNYSNLSLPIIDVSALIAHDDNPGYSEKLEETVKQIGKAIEAFGFFYAVQHGVPQQLIDKIQQEARRFFSMPVEYKQQIHMKNSKVYRGWFQLYEELTSGIPDRKEGLYMSNELPLDHPAVKANTPMHGPNQFPDSETFPGFKSTVLEYIQRLTDLGHSLMEGVALSLHLERSFFRNAYTAGGTQEPFIPFRFFYYPADPVGAFEDGTERFGVREHTDYGCLTLLLTDDVAGLEVKHRATGQWIKAPPVPGAFIINIGDMLQKWTCGKLISTPHRVRCDTVRDRLSIPFFFDPSFHCVVTPLQQFVKSQEDIEKYGTPVRYGDYILAKVFKVFPDLKQDALKFEAGTTEEMPRLGY